MRPPRRRKRAEQQRLGGENCTLSDFPQQLDLGFAAGAAEIALEAGELLRGYFYRGVTAEYKGDVDLVTEADRASEKLIVSRLSKKFPDHGIYGEEGTRSGLERAYRWYVDPLDGTTNFAHGFPFFNISLGLEHRRAGLAPDQDGELVAGVVYDPVHGVRRAGAAALDLPYCAAGRVDGYWEFNLNPWDTAAGVLLVPEPGGAVV